MKQYFKIISFILIISVMMASVCVFGASAESTYTPPEEFIYGDVDMDGEVTVRDATLVQKYVAGLETLSLIQKQSARINDEKITVRGATEIQKHIAGIMVEDSNVGAKVQVQSPTMVDGANVDAVSTGDEISFTQTPYIEWDIRAESFEYFAYNDFYIFDENHYIFNELDGTVLENKYNEKYFEDNVLIVMSFGSGSSSYRYRVDSITKSEGVLGVNYTLLFPESGAVSADVANQRIYIEVSKEDIEAVNSIKTYKNIELY